MRDPAATPVPRTIRPGITTRSFAAKRAFKGHLFDLLTIRQHVIAPTKLLIPIRGMWFGEEPKLPLV